MAWLYNMIAGILRNIINNTGEDFVQNYSCISPENRNNNRIKISGATGLQFDKSGAVKTLDIKQLLQLKNKLLIYAEELVNNKDYVMQMYLVETLDMALKTILYGEFDSEQSIGEIASLNDNVSETGIKLYPRCECSWERKSRGAINHIVVENFIRNFLVIDYSSVKSKYEDHHFYITGDYNRRNRESLKIAAIPYSNKDNYNFRYYNEDICRDFLNEDYINDILRLYKVTLLLVPSHSTGEFDFNNIANICKSKSCCVLWLNTCAAYTEEKSDNFKHISFLSKVPMKGKSDKIDKRGPCKHICEDNCRQDCILQYEIEFLLMRKGE